MILLCSDLDRTLIPNGNQPESPVARPLFRRLVSSGLIRLAYVSGRDKELVRQAMKDFNLPRPDFVIGDVGTTLYRLENDRWNLNSTWQDEIGADWNGYEHDDIVELLTSLDEVDLELQPDAKQSTYKVSYFTDPEESGRALIKSISEILDNKGIKSNQIWSIDEAENKGLLDILPACANKISAIRFLMRQEAVPEKQVVFAGDSGNDMDALTSGLQAILVGNAAPDIRREARETVKKDKDDKKLYLARGGEHLLNGNYAAGVIEGLTYFYPELKDWLRKEEVLLSKSDP